MKNAGRVFAKEIRDLARDKRTRSSAFFGPVMTIFLLLLVFGFLETTISKASSQKVHVVGKPTNVLTTALKVAGVNVLSVPNVEAGKAKIKDGSAKVVLDFQQQGPVLHIQEFFDPNQESSSIAKSVIEAAVTGANREEVKLLLTKQGIDPAEAEPLQVSAHEVTQGNGGVNQLILGLLPYMIIVWAFYGGLGAVSDMVAGEKEKNTLETLLITPTSRQEIALGKLYALSVLCACSSLSSLLALVLAWALHLPITKTLFSNGLGFGPLALLQVIAVLIPTILLFASVLLAVSTRARNVRESQTQLTLISVVFLMPAMMSQFIGFTDFARATWIAAIPVLNSSTTIRQALQGEFHVVPFLMTIGINGALGVAALLYTVSLFKKEDVLLRV